MNDNDNLSNVSKKSFSDLREDESLGKQAEGKHKKKNTYNNLPPFWRSFAYFCYRYFLKGGFLDGKVSSSPSSKAGGFARWWTLRCLKQRRHVALFPSLFCVTRRKRVLSGISNKSGG